MPQNISSESATQRFAVTCYRGPIVFLIGCPLHFSPVTTMLASSFGGMWGWFQAIWCAVSANHKCLGVSKLVLKTVTDADVGGPYLFPKAVLHSPLSTVLVSAE